MGALGNLRKFKSYQASFLTTMLRLEIHHKKKKHKKHKQVEVKQYTTKQATDH